MPAALERHIAPVTESESPRLEIAVVFTSVSTTLAALKHAGTLALRQGGTITLLVPQVVPYSLPLTSPPVLLDWNEHRFRTIAESSAVDTTVRLYLCRDREDVLKQVLSPRSRVVLGGPRRWWRLTAERRLARKLERAGHEVVLIETE